MNTYPSCSVCLTNRYREVSDEEARQKLKWDSNKTALYETKCIIEKKRNYADARKDNTVNAITHVLNKPVSAQEIADLHQSVGWNRMENCYMNSILVSYAHITAYDSDKLIGHIDTVSNNITDAYIQDLMVHPDYQGKDIETELMNRTLQYLGNTTSL